MITCIAVDDELNALGVIKEFIKRIADVELVQCFSNPINALKFATSSKKSIDIVFLDIQMSKLNGLSLVQHLPKDIHIIFTTAHPDYALQGFELDVIDYLLKPFSFERFNRAVQKVKNMLAINKERHDISENALLPNSDDFIFVKSGYKTIKIRLADILYIEGSGNYVTFHTITEKILVLQNLKLFEAQLSSYHFIRVHRSYIISLNHIDSIEKNLVKIHKQEIPISESYKSHFDAFLNKNFRKY